MRTTENWVKKMRIKATCPFFEPRIQKVAIIQMNVVGWTTIKTEETEDSVKNKEEKKIAR